MFDSLTKLFEGKNINRKMTLRNQLKNVKIQNAETIQSYFTRVSQIKEQLEIVDEEVENANIVMTTLNGLPRSWDSFKDYLIPQVSSLKTPKSMFDSLTKLFEGKNINWKMTLRNQLKNVNLQSYFTRVS